MRDTKRKYKKDPTQCEHKRIVKNGKNRNGSQRFKCADCGIPFKEKTDIEEKIYKANLDLIDGQTRYLLCEPYVYSDGEISDGEPLTNYRIKAEKIISWRSFKRKLNKMSVNGPIIVYYRTFKESPKMYEQNLHIARIDIER